MRLACKGKHIKIIPRKMNNFFMDYMQKMILLSDYQDVCAEHFSFNSGENHISGVWSGGEFRNFCSFL